MSVSQTELDRISTLVKTLHGGLLHAYTDRAGLLCIGHHKIVDRRRPDCTISPEIADTILRSELQAAGSVFYAGLPWFEESPADIRAALLCLAVDTGSASAVLDMEEVIYRLGIGDYETAREKLAVSGWYAANRPHANKILKLVCSKEQARAKGAIDGR